MKRGKDRAFVNLGGAAVMIEKGREYPDDHPLVLAHPTLFVDTPDTESEPAKRGSARRSLPSVEF